MRILALGGAGGMGRAAAEFLVNADEVERVVIADIDAARAESVARQLGGKAIGSGLDVTDRAALDAALTDCDLVVNTVGPFFRFAVPILSAAIELGRNYIDICDDWEPTLDMLALNDRARARGVAAVIGMGASPGVTNLLALRAGRELDTVTTVLTGWGVEGTDPGGSQGPSAAMVHGIRQITGRIKVRRAGALVDRAPLERMRFTYPGIGPAEGRTFGHPEAVTLDRAFPHLRENANIVVGNRPALIGLSILRFCVDHRLLTPAAAARIGAWTEQRLPASPASTLKPGGLPLLFAVVTGTRNNSAACAATALAQVPGFTMAANTGIPLAVAATMLVGAARPGVHPPETALDPDEFFAALSHHCIGKPAPAAMTVTTRSWASPHANRESLRSALLTAFLAADVPED